MPNIDVNFADPTTDILNPAVVTKYFGVVRNLVKFAQGIAAITKSTDDDAVVAGITSALDFVEPYLEQQWAYDLLNSVINLFHKQGPVAALDALKSGVSLFQQKS